MKTKRTRWWLKSAALLCATVFGLTAFGDYYKEWSATDKAYWDGDSSWTDVGDTTSTLTDYRVGTTGAQIAFDKAIEGDSVNLYVYGGSTTFSADDASYGLTKPSWFCAGVWFGGAATATFESGTYSFSEINVGRWDSGTGSSLAVAGASVTAPTAYIGSDTLAGSVTITSGTLTASIDGGSQGTLTLNGGTLATTSVANIGSLAVGANGGTFANDAAATISVALTGSGTLTKTGSGTLAITGDISAFKGKIAVAEGAGVTVGDITIAAGEEVQFGVYTWTGAGTATTTTDEGTGVETTTYTDADLWANVNNWLVNGSIPATAPAADSTVVIPEGDGTELSIRISGYGDCTGFLTINRDVKFVRPNSSTNGWGIRVSKVEGTGKLTLAGNQRGNPLVYDWLHIYAGQATNGEIIIDTDLEVAAYVTLEEQTPLRVNGAFSGNARFTCYSNGGQQGVHFYGDTSGFTGSYTGGTRASGSRDGTKFYGSALGSASGSWSFGGDFSTNAGYSPFKAGNDVTYKFGQLTTIFDGYNRLTFETYHKSSNSDYASNVTLEVGGRANSTSNVGGAINGTNNKIVKVGTTSTLNFTASESVGTVEAKEGTTVLKGTIAPAAVKFAGTGAMIKIARSTTTTTEVDSGVEDDESTTDVDESKTTTTTRTDNIAASFVPTFIDEFAGYQYSVAQETADDVTYDVYTVVKVAKDSSDTEYYSVAEAITALAEAEDKTITLIANYDTAVALPLGYSLVMSGFTANVSGVAGVAVEYNEETGTYTTVDNSEAIWQGAAAGANWADAANWSTGRLPDAGTKVVFNYDAIVFLTGCNNHDCGEFNIAQGKEVTLAPVDYNQENWPRVRVSGDITSKGECTLKLFRCGVDNAKADGSAVAVRPTIQFENNGTKDSWMTGSFDFASGLTGTGLFIAYGSNGAGRFKFTSGSINVLEGSVVDFRGGNYPTYSGKDGNISGGGLNGSGRVIIRTIPDNSTDRTYFQNAFKNAEKWSGTCELAGVSFNKINAANFGNVNSTVCFNGVTGYPDFGSDQTEKDIGAVKVIELGANGLTLNDKLSKKYFTISAKLTGSGPIHIATKCDDKAAGKLSYYSFTGDVSEFTGAVDYGTLSSYRPIIVFRNSDEALPTDAVTDYGQIIVTEGKTVNVASTWFGAGGWIINGTVNVASTGSLTCDSNGAKVGGTGTINYAALPTSAPTWNTTAWTGTVVLPETVIKAKTGLQLPALSSANGTLVIKGITRENDQRSLYLGSGATCTVAGTTQLDGDLHITDGNSSATYTWSKITGTGNILFTSAGGSASGITHAITRLDGYTGTIDVGGNATLTLGTVAVDAVEVGTPLVKLSSTCVMADTAVAAVAVEAGGTALANASVLKESDGLYVAAASVDVTTTPDEGDPVTTTTKFATYEAAAAFADENKVTEFAVLYGDGAVNGWDYDSEEGTLTKNTTAIARVGAKQYDTLEAAFAEATANDTVVLFGTSDEAVALAADGATLEIDTTATYTGTLSGDGTVVADAAFTPVFGEWTGTFVVNWNLSGTSSSKAAVILDNYGVSGSTVVVAQALENFYFRHKDKANSADVQPAVYFEADVTQNDGYTYNYNGGLATIFSQVGMAAGKTFATRGAGGNGNKYIFTKLSGFEGTLNVRNTDIVEINGVELAETPAVGTKVVNATAAATASVTAKIADGYPLVVKEDGLYFDPVAQVGEAYYNTLAEAIAAANGGNTVTLVADTTDGYTLAAGDSFSIAWNGHTTGEIVKPTGDFYSTESYNDEAGTTAYTCTAAIGILTVGQTVTPITTAEAAFNGFMAQTTPADSTLRFFTANPLAELSVPCATYDAETLTYTKLAAVAQIGTGVAVIPYPTLAEACAAAEQYGYNTVTLLVALGEQTVPDGWDYNAPETSGTEFGTLTKEMTVTYNVWFVDTDGSTPLAATQTVESGATATKPAEDPVKEGKVFVAWTLGGTAYDFSTPVTATITLMASWKDAPTDTEADDGSGNKFTVPATVATPADKTLTDAATGTINYAQAYALGLWDGTAEGEVAEPTVSINIVDGKVQVAFAGGTVPEAYTVTTILQYKTTLGTSEWQNVTGATGALGATLTDSSEMGANKFYRVIVTITNKQLVSE